MNADEMLFSFLRIVQCVSLEEVLIDSNRPLREVLSEQIDSLDFELAVTCFEATHRVTLDYADLEDTEIESLTVEQLITNHLVADSRELSDPLFVARRFCMYRKALLDALEKGEG